MVEGARLESEYGSKAHPGFESLPLRHTVIFASAEKSKIAGFLSYFPYSSSQEGLADANETKFIWGHNGGTLKVSHYSPVSAGGRNRVAEDLATRCANPFGGFVTAQHFGRARGR